ncbi:36_t:CDS:2 [Racocetra fulgida]|uniref:36_t:CDS:1 n=1 Tax=Racocetra fulgida TaxID=60492 RepID=A0A9N9FTC8_9GLOM|nr:36_t:CDS:2 [Racocetra fulgida]
MASWEYTHKEFPKVPTLEEVDKSDVEDQQVREYWIKVMEIRLVRNQLIKCYKTEGVNHYKNCKKLADLYVELLKEYNSKEKR